MGFYIYINRAFQPKYPPPAKYPPLKKLKNSIFFLSLPLNDRKKKEPEIFFSINVEKSNFKLNTPP